LLNEYRPNVVVHEINQQSPDYCVSVIKDNQVVSNDGSNYHGANICAFYCLAQNFEYSMIYCESNGFYCFWIKNDLLKNQVLLDLNIVKKTLNAFFLFKKAGFDEIESDKTWNQIEKCY
jgi:hypothetical protein